MLFHARSGIARGKTVPTDWVKNREKTELSSLISLNSLAIIIFGGYNSLHIKYLEERMKKTVITLTIIAVFMSLLAGCGKTRPAGSATPIPEPPVTAEIPAPTEAPVQTAPPATPAPTAEPVRQDGERFETVIMLEGMEETVNYEHIRREDLGFEMDYDYESFARVSDPEQERFLSVWDDPNNPENYMDLIYSPADAETVAAFVSEAFSKEYDITTVPREFDHAGTCTRIEASVIKGTNNMAEQIQTVYIIPASDGCVVATVHSFITESEGFGHRFNYMLDTLKLIDRGGETALSEEQALAAIRNYCIAVNPELEGIANAGEYPAYWELSSGDAREIVVLFRSYSGALVRYYIDRATGDTYATEFVPGITPEEVRTEESLNVWDYLG